MEATLKKIIAAVLALVLIAAVPASFASANIDYTDFETGTTTTMYCSTCGCDTACEECVNVGSIYYYPADIFQHVFTFYYDWVCTVCNSRWSTNCSYTGCENHDYVNDVCTLCSYVYPY